jgi:indole-3-glycerol phosphate synthase
LFVLLEGFDRGDLERIAMLGARGASPPILAGVNCRDLRDLDVRFERFAALAPYLPEHLPAVAESGIASVADVRAVAELGFELALIGSSLMRAAKPDAALAAMVSAGRAAVEH